MLFADTTAKLNTAIQQLHQISAPIAYDIETSGLNRFKDEIIGIGIVSGVHKIYICLSKYNPSLNTLENTNVSTADIVSFLQVLSTKKLIMHNASFDVLFTKQQFNVDLTEALACDTLLLKHTCDEEFPFGLKEIATKLWGNYATDEKTEMQESIKLVGGSSTEYYKADAELIGKYCIKDCELTNKLYVHYSKELKQQGLETFFYSTEIMPFCRKVLLPLNEHGIHVNVLGLQIASEHIDADIAYTEKQLRAQLAEPIAAIEEKTLAAEFPLLTAKTLKPSAWTKKFKTQREAWGSEPVFNFKSNKQLQDLFFNYLALKPVNKTPKGAPQIDEEFLASLPNELNWVIMLKQYKKLQKLKSSYIDTMLAKQHKGIYYADYKAHRTVSGRLASDIQQLPRPIAPGSAPEAVVRHVSSIRSFIVPSANSLLLSADYNQLEPTLFAHVSGDPQLQAIFNTGLDFYSEIAIKTERLIDVSSDKSAPNYLGKIDKAARQKAKAYALGLAYGMTPYKLQFELNVPIQEAELLAKKYFEGFPQLAAWIESTRVKALEHACISTELGRMRRLPNIKRLHAKYGKIDLTNSLELFKHFGTHEATYAQAKLDRKTYQNELNNAINFQIQGLAASIMNLAAIQIVEKIKINGYKSRLVGQLHDELIFDVPLAEQTVIGPLVKHIMENVVKLSVPLVVEPQFGTTYAECK